MLEFLLELVGSKTREKAYVIGSAFIATGIGRGGRNCAQSFCCEIQKASTGKEHQTRRRQSTVGRRVVFVLLAAP